MQEQYTSAIKMYGTTLKKSYGGQSAAMALYLARLAGWLGWHGCKFGCDCVAVVQTECHRHGPLSLCSGGSQA